jgi:subtilisin family serine protease
MAATLTAPAATGQESAAEQWAVDGEAVVRLPAAWGLSLGAGATVAVVDSGANLRHPDLAPNLWVNADERPGNGVDDDANGYVDDVNGVDLTTRNARNVPADENGHGTHVAGLIAAARDGRGVVGAAPRAKLMLVRVLDRNGGGSIAATAEGIRYAAANGARIINCSIATPGDDPMLRDAIAFAGRAGALVVASAGNQGADVDRAPVYPAAIAAPNLIAVAATSPRDGRRLADLSNFGRTTIGLAAPGEGVLSTARDGGYEVRSGTSMAAPYVAGVAALMLSLRPDILAPEMRAAILGAAAPSTLPVSAGYLDAQAAVRAVTTRAMYDLGQRPRVEVIRAAAMDTMLQLDTCALGATAAIRSYRIELGGRRIARVRGAEVLHLLIRGVRRAAGRRVRVRALGATGRTLAVGTARVAVSRDTKPRIGGAKVVRAT